MAELSCGGSCMKYLLFLFNIIFFLCGSAVLAIGIWIKVDDDVDSYLTVIDFNQSNQYFDDAVLMLISIGAVVFLIGFLGFCGACLENISLLGLYAVFLVIIMILQLATGVLVIVFQEELGTKLEEEMISQVKNDVTNDTSITLNAAWFTMQYNFQCCGGNDYTDYFNSTYHDQSGEEVPLSCCVLVNDDPLDPLPLNKSLCLKEAVEGSCSGSCQYLYTKGCYDSLEDWLSENIYIVIGTVFAVAFLEIFGVVIACCLRTQLINPGTYK